MKLSHLDVVCITPSYLPSIVTMVLYCIICEIIIIIISGFGIYGAAVVPDFGVGNILTYW